MFFSEVLEVHDSCTPQGSHPDILGDGFLMHSNPIYKNIKAETTKIGGKYVEAYPDYLLLPFHELPTLMQKKEIPFVPAARLMRKVEDGRPGVFATEDLPMPESYHLHESAHLVADHVLQKLNAKNRQEEILKAMTAESFANTVDALVWTSAEDEMHWFFLKQNSYMFPQKKVIKAMNELTENLGFKFTFVLTYFTYLNANFLVNPLSKKAIQDLANRYATGKVDAKLQKSIHAVCEIGEKLDPLFRFKTTGNYFKQRGFEGDVESLLDFPFMKSFEANQNFAKAVEDLAGKLA